MIITKYIYQKIQSIVEDYIYANRPASIELADALGIEYDTLTSIFSQLQVRSIRLLIKQFDNKTMKNIIKRINTDDELISNIAREFHFSPYKLAKMYIDNVYNKTITISNVIKDPLLIESERIRNDILKKCCTMDSMVTWDIDVSKHVIGHEYEEYLINMLNSYNLCFETEEDLRNKGKAKTPDILFLIPMGIKLPKSKLLHTMNVSGEISDSIASDDNNSTAYMNSERDSGENQNVNKKLFDDLDEEGVFTKPASKSCSYQPQSTMSQVGDDCNSENDDYVIINWIDSKALFADEVSLQENLDQLQGYVNRYGRGLVIYWHGYVDSIVEVINQRYDHTPTPNPNDTNMDSNSNSNSNSMGTGGSNVNDISYLVRKPNRTNGASADMIDNSSSSASVHNKANPSPIKPSSNSMIYVSDSLPTQWLFPTGESIE